MIVMIIIQDNHCCKLKRSLDAGSDNWKYFEQSPVALQTLSARRMMFAVDVDDDDDNDDDDNDDG